MSTNIVYYQYMTFFKDVNKWGKTTDISIILNFPVRVLN